MEFDAGRGVAVSVARLTVASLLSEIGRRLEAGRGIAVSYLNFHTVNIIRRQPELADLFNAFDAVTPEGVAVIRSLQWLGQDVGRENILSAEFVVPPLLREAVRLNWPVYLVGGRPGVADAAARTLRGAFSGVNIVGAHHGHFTSAEEARAVAQDIERSESRVVLVSMGQPHQEQWIVAHRRTLGPAVVIAIGGYFDKISKMVEAYPRWVYSWHAFWVYRLVTEPRLWRRYLQGGTRFALHVLALKWRVITTR